MQFFLLLLGKFFLTAQDFFLIPFNSLLPPFPKVHCHKTFDFQNPCGKVMKKVVSDSKTFAHKGSKIAAARKKIYLRILSFVHSVKTSFCPHVPKSNVQTFQILGILGESYRKKWSQIWKLLLIMGVKLPCKKIVFWRILPYWQDFLVLLLLSTSVKRLFVSGMWDFYL